MDIGPAAILIGMEASGVIRDEFRALGFNAWSCDTRECEADPRWHLRCDVNSILTLGWLMAIFHPDCTYLTNSAEWALNDPDFDRYPGVGYHQRVKPGTLTGQPRRDARAQAIRQVETLLDAPIEMIAIENPRGTLGTSIRKADQVIHPPQFGEDASKETHLWLKNLPKLRPTGWRQGRIVENDPQHLFGGGVERWANQSDSGQNRLSESDDRWIDRSRTFPGIARAMARQWGDWLIFRHGVKPMELQGNLDGKVG